MKSIYTLIILFAITVAPVYSQHKDHHHKRNEIGLSTGAMYGINDKKWGAGGHLHYSHSLSDHSRWAIGGFAEYAWLSGTHFSLGAGAKFQALDRLHLGIFPGITILKHKEDDHDHGHSHDEGSKLRFSTHIEAAYDLFSINGVHFGIVADYAWAKHDSHVMLGIHTAFSF